MRLQSTLVTDGSADVVLVPVLEWLLSQLTPEEAEIRWADLRLVRPRPETLQQRLDAAIALYPCRLLFVHRDAEREAPDSRFLEIERANTTGLPHVSVVPVRMQEAWLLHDERALRRAADRPSGMEPLNLPPVNRWERLRNPKEVLHTALRIANGATGRRAKRFRPDRAAHRLADLITDWSPLRQLSAFRRLETDTRTALTRLRLIPEVGRP